MICRILTNYCKISASSFTVLRRDCWYFGWSLTPAPKDSKCIERLVPVLQDLGPEPRVCPCLLSLKRAIESYRIPGQIALPIALPIAKKICQNPSKSAGTILPLVGGRAWNEWWVCVLDLTLVLATVSTGSHWCWAERPQMPLLAGTALKQDGRPKMVNVEKNMETSSLETSFSRGVASSKQGMLLMSVARHSQLNLLSGTWTTACYNQIITISFINLLRIEGPW